MKRLRRYALTQSERLLQYKALFEHSPYGIYSMDPAGNVLSANPAFEAMTGYKVADWLGRSFLPLVAPESLADTARTLELCLRGEQSHYEAVLLHRDGHRIVLNCHSFPMVIQGEIVGIFGTAKDITRRKQAEALVRKQAVAMDTVADGVAILGEDGTYLYVNKALTAIFGYDGPMELIGRNWRIHCGPEELHLVEASVIPQIRQGGTWGGQLNAHRRDGVPFPAEVTVNRIPDGGFVCVVRDITERKAVEQQLAHQAYHDFLTNLPNRKLFVLRLEEALARAAQSGGDLTVLFLDLNGFKHINDSLGHETGDQVLILAAERLRACLRGTDTVARMGGDEFLILLDGVADEPTVQEISDRLVAALSAPFFVSGQVVQISTSLGFARGAGRPACEIIHQADTAMYRMKQQATCR